MSWFSAAVFFVIGWAIWTYTVGTVIHEYLRPAWWDAHPRRRVPAAAVVAFFVMATLTAAVFGVVDSSM